MGSYFYNRDLSGDKVMENLKQVIFERSHFPWNSSPQVFPKLFIHCFSMRVMFSKMYFYSCLCFSLLESSFFSFIPSSSSCCGTDTNRNSGGKMYESQVIQIHCKVLSITISLRFLSNSCRCLVFYFRPEISEKTGGLLCL